jgi:hypothetical protein
MLHETDACHGNVNAITLSSLHRFGVTCDDDSADFSAGFRHRGDETPQIVHRETFLQDKRCRQEKGASPCRR